MYICFALLLSISSTAGAQEPVTAGSGGYSNKTSPFEVGLRLGWSSAGVDDRGSLWDDSRTGLVYGVFAKYAVSRMFSFGLEAAGVQKGATTEDYGTFWLPSSTDASLELNCIEIAAVMRLGMPIEGPLRPALLGGMSMAFVTSSELVAEGLETSDLSDETESLNLGYVAGFELAYQFESVTLFTDVRYARELEDFHTSAFIKWVNYVISIGGGVTFRL